MIRIFALALTALAVALSLAIAYVFVQELDWRAANNQVHARQRKEAVKTAAETARRELPPLPPAISAKEVAEWRWAATPKPPSGTKDDYTWEQVEKIFAGLRGERAARPQATNDLDAWYDHVASPDFTNSPDVPRHLEELEAWRQEMPASPTPLLILGKAHILHAWQARGGGYADTVTPEGARLFEERLTEAQTFLQHAVDLGHPDGEAIAAQIQIAKGRSLPKAVARGLLAQGMKTDPSYNGLYIAIAEYLLPRWYGEQGEVERLANEIAAELPGDDGLNAVGQIAFIVNHYDPHTLFDGEYDRSLLAKSADVLVRRYAQDPNLVAFAALCAYVAQDHTACRRAEPFLSADDQVKRVPNWAYYARDIRPWCAARKVPNDQMHYIWGGNSPYGDIAFDTDSRYFWCGNGWSENTVKLLDAKTGRTELVLPGPRASLNDMAFDVRKKWVAAYYVANKEDTGWIVWNTKSPDDPLITKIEGRMQAIAINPTQDQLALGFSEHVELFDLKTRTVTAKIDLREGPYKQNVRHLRYSPDGSLLAVNERVCKADDAQVLFDLVKTLKPEKGKLATLLTQSVVGFDLGNHLLITALVVKPTNKRSLVRFAADGQTWETVIEDLGEHSPPMALSPDGKLLAGLGPYHPQEPQNIAVWNLETGKKIKQFGGHWRHIGSMAFSPDGKMLASIERMGGPIKFWSLEGPSAAEQDAAAQAEKAP